MSAPLTDEELDRLRNILKNDERMAWFWASVRRWAGWGAAAFAAIYAAWDTIVKFFNAFIVAFSRGP